MRSSSATDACTFDRPVPRFLGRRNSGERVTRRRRMPAVNSSATRGTASGSAWSLRSPRLEREPGTSAYRAKQIGVEQARLARAGRTVDEEQPLGGRARRRRRRPGPRTARTPRSRGGGPSRRAHRAGCRAVGLAPRDPLVVAAPAARPGWPRRPRRSAPARRRSPRDRRARGPGSRSTRRRRSSWRPGRHTVGAGRWRPGGRTRSSRVCGKRRRTCSMAPSGRAGSVRVTWHHAASAARWAGSASSSSRLPRSTASGRCDGRLDVLDGTAGHR